MNTITPNIEPKPSTQRREKVAGSFLKAILAVLLLAVAMEGPVLAQTTNAVDDGTVLKEIIFFGRHSIRTATSGTKQPGPVFSQSVPRLCRGYSRLPYQNGQRAAGLLGSYFHEYLRHEGLLTGDAVPIWLARISAPIPLSAPT